MASASGRAPVALSDQLFQDAHGFDFFQAVRLLERIVARSADDTAALARGQAANPVGRDAAPSAEVVRFQSACRLTFPAGEIAQLSRRLAETGKSQEGPPAMEVSFLGLTGPAGALPRHYTSLVIERSHARHKDRAMRDFFDLFNHRTISLFYRAWEKYRFFIGYERGCESATERERDQEDLFTYCLHCFVGLGTAGLRQRFAFNDEMLLYYSGNLSRRTRPAVSLEAMLADLLNVDVQLLQFRGQWLYLNVQDQSSFPSRRHPGGRNLELGRTAIAGSKVWDVQSKFRVRLGPLTLAQFSQFLPSGSRFLPVCQCIRFYAGVEFDFDLQLVLKGPEVPWCRFSSDAADGPRLGWNTWIRSDKFRKDVDDPVFTHRDFE